MAERADEFRALIDEYMPDVPDEFRDDAGVWHDGKPRIAAFDALDALLAELENARQQRLRDLEMVRRMAKYGSGPGTDEAAALLTIANWAEKKAAAASGGGSDG